MKVNRDDAQRLRETAHEREERRVHLLHFGEVLVVLFVAVVLFFGYWCSHAR